MYRTIKLRPIGSSTGVILPKEVLEEMHVENGDEMFMVRTDQGILLTPHDPDFFDAMEAFNQVRKQYRNAFRELAK